MIRPIHFALLLLAFGFLLLGACTHRDVAPAPAPTAGTPIAQAQTLTPVVITITATGAVIVAVGVGVGVYFESPKLAATGIATGTSLSASMLFFQQLTRWIPWIALGGAVVFIAYQLWMHRKLVLAVQHASAAGDAKVEAALSEAGTISGDVKGRVLAAVASAGTLSLETQAKAGVAKIIEKIGSDV